jgi:chemotaxis protein MotB
MKNVADDIKNALQPLIAQGKVKLLETSRGVTIEINDSILFPPGRPGCNRPRSMPCKPSPRCSPHRTFRSLSRAYRQRANQHAAIPSNWELSAMRATTVLRLFNDGGVGAERLTAIGYGETRPLATNTTIEGVRKIAASAF